MGLPKAVECSAALGVARAAEEHDRVASEWADDEDWIEKRNGCSSRKDVRNLLNFALKSVKHSTVHRPRIGERVKAYKESQGPRKVCPPDKTISVRSEGTAVQMCGIARG